jgi:xanthine dehydrogenase accessory factor
VLPFLDEAMAQGQRVALVTLVGVSGSSPRPLGSQLAVREDGASVGLISGGCVEPSLVLDAVQAIRDRRCHLGAMGRDRALSTCACPAVRPSMSISTQG